METRVESPTLTISGLSKAYRVGFLATSSRPALMDLSLEVHRGEIFGFLGPNGSGKTTTLKLLMGLAFPDAGSATILGAPLGDARARERIGYLPEHPYFYDYLTPGEYLDYAGRLFGMSGSLRRERSRTLLDRVGLSRVAHVPLRRFSKGMAQRLGIAQALVNDPELVFLDEPMSGLDPIGRRLVRDIIVGLREQGKTVFFSTHILSDAETLCDRVALIKAGRLASVGRLDEILSQDVSHLEVLLSGGDASILGGIPGIRARRSMGERSRLEIDEGSLVGVLQSATAAGARVLSVNPIRQSLEDYFVKEMGEAPDAERMELGD
jgi:ABC-2 type transport system ATP-binding protein